MLQKMNQDCDSWHSYFPGLFNLRGSDVEYNPVFFAYAVIGMNTIRCLYSPLCPRRCVFLLENFSRKAFVLKMPMLEHFNVLDTFDFNINFSPSLIRARQAAKSSAAFLSTLADLLGDLAHDGWPLCLSSWSNVEGPWSPGWNVGESQCWPRHGRLFSNVSDESLQNCRDYVEKLQGWHMTEGFFPVTALYNEPQQGPVLQRHLQASQCRWGKAWLGDYRLYVKVELNFPVQWKQEQCGA